MSVREQSPSGEGVRPILEVHDLSVAFPGPEGPVEIVRGVDLAIAPGEVLGLVGESGSGKSLLARAILGILPQFAKVTRGRIRFSDLELSSLSPQEVRRLRGDRIAFVPQEPMTSLNPVLRIGRQLTEVLDVHRPDLGRKEKIDLAVSMLDLVGIRYARDRLAQYPHQLSGGLRQRVTIAMALICERVELLIADEPTTALDVTIQAQILDLFVRLQLQNRMSMLLITHDLAVVAETTHRVAVMYAGEIVEVAPVHDLVANPRHPYTSALLKSLPRIGTAQRKSDLPAIAGTVPSFSSARRGCSFADRCSFRDDARCFATVPTLETVGPGRSVRCHRRNEIVDQLALWKAEA